MPSNRTSNDIDLAQLTQYDVQLNRVTKNPLLKPWPLSDFTHFQVDDFSDHVEHDWLWALRHPVSCYHF